MFLISDNTRTEIIIVTAPQTNSNLTLENGNIQIHVQLKNKTTPSSKRVKRELSSYFENSAEENDREILNGKKMNEAREVVMKYNAPCSQGNTVEICKDLVTKLQSLGDNKNANDFQDNKNNLSKPKYIGIDARGSEELSSTEKSRRQSHPLENIEMIRAEPNMPFHGKESRIFDDHESVHSFPQRLHTSPIPSSCVMRILNRNFPSAHGKCFLLYQECSNQQIQNFLKL